MLQPSTSVWLFMQTPFVIFGCNFSNFYTFPLTLKGSILKKASSTSLSLYDIFLKLEPQIEWIASAGYRG